MTNAKNQEEKRSRTDKFIRSKIVWLAQLIANPYTFLVVLVLCLVWIAYGFHIGFPNDWINGTQVVITFGAFFIIFIVQFSEETDTTAEQRKLDAIIEADKKIDQSVIGHEEELKGIAP